MIIGTVADFSVLSCKWVKGRLAYGRIENKLLFVGYETENRGTAAPGLGR